MPGRIDGTGILESDGGSSIAATDVQLTGDLRGVRGDGVGFGALRLTSWAESTTIIEGLTFEEASADWFPFLMAGGVAGTVATHDPDDNEEAIDRRSLSRRGLLVTIGAATFLIGKSAGQSDETQTYNVATFDLIENLRGTKIDIDTAVANWLEGEDVTFFVSADGQSIGSFQPSEPGKTINPGTNGTVELESDTALSFIEELLAKARSEDKVVFEFRPQDTSFAEETVGDEIELSSEPVVVETVNAADPSEVVIKMNGTMIPNADESGSTAVGEWYVRDNTSLVYVVGEETPDTSLVEVQVNVGHLERTWQELRG